MKRVLVTGGGGYIGSHLVNKLVSQGYGVRVFDSFYFGTEPLKSLKNQIEIVEGDIRDINLSVLRNIDTIIHLAALSNDQMADVFPELTYEINTYATERLAQLAKKAHISRFIFASSASIYHQDKNSGTNHTEDDSVKPEGHYSLSKYFAEKNLYETADKTFKVIIFRMATVNGASIRMRFDLVINAMVKSALEEKKVVVFSGNQVRPIIDIRDVTQAYISALTVPLNSSNYLLLNIAYKNYTVADLAREVQKSLVSLGVPTQLVQKVPKQKSKNYRISAQKSYGVLNFQPLFAPSDTVSDLYHHITNQKFNMKNTSTYDNFGKMESFLSHLPLKYT